MKLKYKLLIIILVLPVSLFAQDFGLVTSVYSGYGYSGDEDNAFDFKANLWPRFSCLIGDNSELYVAAGVTLDNEDGFRVFPELLRIEFSTRFGSGGLRVGRINYSDPFSIIASGLFDGAQYYISLPVGRFSAGVWYTGFLFKERANITMTSDDYYNYYKPLDYSDFINTYFASKRLIAALDWSHPSIARILRLNVSAIWQFDLNDSGNKYHSQYIVLKSGIQFNKFLIEAGGAVEFSQSEADDFSTGVALAGVLGFAWILPTSFSSSLSFNARIAGGKIEDSLETFNPVTTKYFSNILECKMSGVSVFDIGYQARFNQKMSTSLSVLYFVRNDLAAFSGYPLSKLSDKSDGYFLGGEIFAQFTYKPFSDLQFNLGGGAFLPALGNTAPEEKPLWRLELTAVISIF